MSTWVKARIEELQKILEKLIAATIIPFDGSIRSSLPEAGGVYAISLQGAAPGEYIIAGRTKGAGGLRQRIYQNHLMGNQTGNLRSKFGKR